MFNVLLVDDEPWVLEGLRTMIGWEKHGFRICGEALSGPDALRMIQQHRPELVITDIHMPVLNGLELIEQSNQLMEKPPHFVILSGYDDFNYARTALRQRAAGYLLKPIDDEEIEALLSTLSQKIKADIEDGHSYEKQQYFAVNHAINRLIQGERSEGLISQAGSSMNLKGDEEIRCLLIESVFESAVFKQIFTRHCGDALGHCFQDRSGRNGIMFVLRNNGMSDGRLEETIHGIHDDLSKHAKQPVIVSVSQQMSGIRSLRELYLQAAETGGMKRSQAKSGVFFYRDLQKKDPRRDLRHEATKFKRLVEKVQAGDLEETTRHVQNIFACFPGELPDIEIMKAQAADLELTLCRLITEMNGEPDSFMAELNKFFGNLGVMNDYRLLETYVENVCLQAAGILDELRQQNEGNTIFQVIQYVDHEFRNKLQLQDLARQFHLNATYLGQLFKKNTGKPFNEYLNDRRMEEAKRLLKRTSMKIADVAVQVGFPNTDYFIYKFKRKTGVLPSVFKKDAGSKPDSDKEEPPC